MSCKVGTVRTLLKSRYEVSERSCMFNGRGNPIVSLDRLINYIMALKSSTQENCSCFSTDAFRDLSSKEREGAHFTCSHARRTFCQYSYSCSESQASNKLITFMTFW